MPTNRKPNIEMSAFKARGVENPSYEDPKEKQKPDLEMSKTNGIGVDNPSYYKNPEKYLGNENEEGKSNNEDEEEEEDQGAVERCVDKFYGGIHNFYKRNKKIIHYTFLGLLLVGYFALVIAACIVNFKQSLALLVLTLIAIFFFFWDLFIAKYGDNIAEALKPCQKFLDNHWSIIRWFVYGALLLAVILWLTLDTAKRGANQVIPFFGLIMYILLVFIFSKHPTKVRWRIVIWGLLLQFIFGLIILRTKPGLDAFNWLGIQVQTFLKYTDAGSRFIFGDNFEDHFFAFAVLPIVIFFSTVMSMMYYLGLMQWLILKVGWLMQITMGTSPMESMVSAGNIFVGQTESPLLIRPYLADLTISEMHSVMSCGFATIAGSVLGAYISLGIPAAHLLTASVMSAPAALAISKTFWPETKKSKNSTQTSIKLEKGQENNLLEAASQGASAAVPLVANIAANLIAFLAVLAFINATLSWLGSMFNYPQFSFEIICSYVLMPFAFMMGVNYNDSFLVAELLGMKTFFNEFVAYQRLSEYIHYRESGGPLFVDGVRQYMSVRSEAIATYALCGFANFGSLGIMIGGLSSLAPHRKHDIASCGIRALIAGTIACFTTACIAGVLYIPELYCPNLLMSTLFENGTTENTTNLMSCCTDLFKSTTMLAPKNITFTEGFNTTMLNGCCAFFPSGFNCSEVRPE
uniref:Sodium/nucleoside cotransporter n=1 Tax=Eptatretus burgeri TaxID=7764 RepID=A0A8C4WWN3_EPTBU